MKCDIIIFLLIILFSSSISAFYVTNGNEFLLNSSVNNSIVFWNAENITLNVYNRTWLNFNENNNQVTIPSSSLYSPNSSDNKITISFWVYMNNFSFKGQSSTAEYTNYFGKSAYSPNRCEYVFRMENSSGLDGSSYRPCRFSFYAFNSSCGLGVGAAFQDNDTATSCTSLNNTWMFISGRINGTGISIFKNGVQRDNALLSSLGIQLNTTTAGIFIGKDIDNGQWNGQIDNIRIYNSSLTNEEIGELYNAGVTENISSVSVYNESWMNFNGYNGHIDTQYLQSNFGNEISFTGWYYRNNNDSQHVIFGGDTSQSVLVRLEKDNDINFWANQSGSGITWQSNSSNGRWINYAFVFNDTNGNITLYLDGTKVTSQTTGNNLTKLGVIHIGRRQGTANYFNGSIDDFAIYNMSLNSSDILTINNSGRSKNTITSNRLIYLTFNNDKFSTFYDNATGNYIGDLYNQLITINNLGVTHQNDGIITGNRTFTTNSNYTGYWRLNENSGNVAHDSSSYKINGTISGATWNNDGIFIKLIENVDYIYTRLKGLFQILNSNYFYSWGNVTQADYNISDYALLNNSGTTSKNLQIYGLTNSLIYNTNNSIYGNSNISLNDGNINITLPSKNVSYGLDVVNLTEGVSREYSPLGLNKTSYLTNNGRTTNIIYSLNSSLTQSINQVDFIASTYCPTASDTITYKSHLGINNTYSYVCLNSNTVKFTIDNWDSSNSSNTLTIVYNPEGIGGSPSGGGGGDFITLALNKTLNQTNQTTNQTTNKTIENLIIKEEIECELSSVKGIKECFLDIIEDIWPGKSLRNFALFLLIITSLIIIVSKLIKEYKKRKR